jgi:hypothetical protein
LYPETFPDTISRMASRPSAAAKRLSAHRRRQRGSGLVRVELTARERDAALLREIATLLRAGAPGADQLRDLLARLRAAAPRAGAELLDAMRLAVPVPDALFEIPDSPPSAPPEA